MVEAPIIVEDDVAEVDMTKDSVEIRNSLLGICVEFNKTLVESVGVGTRSGTEVGITGLSITLVTETCIEIWIGVGITIGVGAPLEIEVCET